MAFITIWNAVTAGLAPLFKIVDDIIPDKDKSLALKTQIQMAMISSRWNQLMVLISGSAIVCACLFNLICKSLGICGAVIDFATPEILILLGIFVFSASGSAELLMAVAQYLLEKMKETNKKGKEK